MTSALRFILCLSLMWLLVLARPLAAAEAEVSVDVSLSDLVVLGSAGGTGASPISPATALGVVPSSETPPAESVARLCAAGLMNDAGRLTDRGAVLSKAIMAPDTAWQIRRIADKGISFVWYLETGEQVWALSPKADVSYRLLGAFPSHRGIGGDRTPDRASGLARENRDRGSVLMARVAGPPLP